MTTPPPINSKDFLNNEEPIIISTEKNKIKIDISYNESSIAINIEELNSFPINQFYLFISFEELKKINKYFQYFDSSDEFIKTFKESIKNNSIKILVEGKKCEIEILNPILNSKFHLNIPIKEKTVQDELGGIIPIIMELQKKVEKLEKENEELKKKILEFELKFQEFEKVKEKTIKNNEFFEDSKIITKKEEKDLILAYLPKKPNKVTLIYDSKIYGDSAKIFHSQCDGKSPTLYIIKSQKGYKFGGYISQPWKSNNSYTQDNEAFVFSLNLKKKYILQNPKEAFYGNPDWGPVMRGGIYIDIYNCCEKN